MYNTVQTKLFKIREHFEIQKEYVYITQVHDYVKSYLGDGKEPREFAKQFLDRRSKFRAKQTPAEVYIYLKIYFSWINKVKYENIITSKF